MSISFIIVIFVGFLMWMLWPKVTGNVNKVDSSRVDAFIEAEKYEAKPRKPRSDKGVKRGKRKTKKS